MKTNLKSQIAGIVIAFALGLMISPSSGRAAITLVWGAQNDDNFALAASDLATKLPTTIGSVALLGFYNSPVTASTFSAYTSASQFLTNFTQLAATTVGNGTSLAGTFSGGGSISTATGSIYDGKQLFYLVGNAATVSASTQMGVFTKSSWIVPANPSGPTPTTYTTDINQVTNDASSILFGSFLANGGSYGTDAYKLQAVIPEPATGSLLMIGAVGLLALRRLRKV